MKWMKFDKPFTIIKEKYKKRIVNSESKAKI